LLHSGADAVVVVLGFDDGDRDVGLEVEDVVGKLGFPPTNRLALDDDSTLREIDFLADLGVNVPSRLLDSRRDVLGANVAFAERFLVDCGHGEPHVKGGASGRSFWGKTLEDLGRVRLIGCLA